MSMIGTNRHELSRRAAERRPAATDSAALSPAIARPTGWRRFGVIPLLWFLAAAALVIDLPFSQFWHQNKAPGFIVDVFESAESFGNGAGVVLLLLVVYRLGVIRPRSIWRLALASLGSGLVADAFKLIIARTRPRDLTIQQNALETFDVWWPSFKAHTGMQSFPSAHVATAVGLAYALSHFHPRGRWVFGGLVVLVALQRCQTGAHFVSDTLAGAAIAWGLVMILYHAPLLAPWFDRFEGLAAGNAAASLRVPAPHRTG